MLKDRYDLTKSDAARFRPRYKNSYCGWFGVVDCAYKFDNPNIKVAAAYGYVSGDTNPHEVEKNKNYHDFVGINEWYCGKRVPSVFLLCEKIIKVPVSFSENSTKVTIDNTFSNLHHFGFGATWWPQCCKSKKVKINPNALFFWRARGSLKYDVTKSFKDGDYSNNEEFKYGLVDRTTGKPYGYASKYLGTELNLVISSEPLPDFSVFATAAIFIPGGFYKDIKGIPNGDIFTKIHKDIRKEYKLNPLDYRLNDDTAFFLDAGVSYKF